MANVIKKCKYCKEILDAKDMETFEIYLEDHIKFIHPGEPQVTYSQL